MVADIIIIIPSWDSVDIATIFFMSFSLVAVSPAVIVVAAADDNSNPFVIVILILILNRFIIHTPAVTRVDE